MAADLQVCRFFCGGGPPGLPGFGSVKTRQTWRSAATKKPADLEVRRHKKTGRPGGPPPRDPSPLTPIARQPKAERKPPACYALVVPGLEVLASEEIATDLKAEVRKTERGLVVFRVPEVNEAVLALRTTEDVFLLAWGTDQLTYRVWT